MSGRGGGGGRRVLLPPINFIFKLLQQRATVQVWLYEQTATRIEGKIQARGQILLKGDNVSLIQSTDT
ncbi:MAG: mRNA splicing protein sme1 [Bogoriella megaspora]|nr:MAG: mRNA splicing protein sme1 [Bogoriella megaspora]